jgi:hypothetical protein
LIVNGIIHPQELLRSIRVQCELLISDGQDALEDKLTTEGDDTDNSEARANLKEAVGAAKLLLAHLDANYDFDTGFAEVKEGVCLD